MPFGCQTCDNFTANHDSRREKYRSRSFSIAAPGLWNSLSVDLRKKKGFHHLNFVVMCYFVFILIVKQNIVNSIQLKKRGKHSYLKCCLGLRAYIIPAMAPRAIDTGKRYKANSSYAHKLEQKNMSERCIDIA